jgi:hypothetical protein
MISDKWIDCSNVRRVCDSVSRSLRTGRLERELQMVQLSAARCSCIAIFWVSVMSFASMSLCVSSRRVFIVVNVYFVTDSVRKLLDAPSYINTVLNKKWPISHARGAQNVVRCLYVLLRFNNFYRNWHTKVHYRVRNNQPRNRKLSQMNPVQIFTPCFF